MPERTESLTWMREGTALFVRAADRLEAPSALPGWTGKHVVAHVANNAEALRNLVHWAATGIETPQYASAEQRDADIEAGAAAEITHLREAYAKSARQLEEDLSALTEEQWQARVRTRKGAEISATEIPWMRAREVMIHAVDLGGVVSFRDLPSDFLAALVDDVVRQRSAQAGETPTIELLSQDTGEAWRLLGTDESVRVMARIADLAAWLTGRENAGIKVLGPGRMPELPAWL